ncbi:DUF1648 domain-containing protein [Maribacter sp. 2308TA10-17]|uniref:DUF1648 domain-containing protein n=1 Tax=Maribacter sp. 2308TA10-17 TaxID=3386276 RepID=UPI0039BCA629
MFRKRPKIKVELTKIDKKIIRFGWVLLLLNLGLILVFYSDLPEKIPTHFNLRGEVDGYGERFTIWILAVVGILLYYALNLVISKIPAYKHNYPVKLTEKNAPTIYRLSLKMMVLLNISIVFLFLLISTHTILISKDIYTFPLIQIVLIGTIFIILMPFFFIYKMFKVPK